MNRYNPRSPWVMTNALPLSLWAKDLDWNVVIDPMEKPLTPIISVNDSTMAVRGVTQVARLVYLLPLVIVSWFLLHLTFSFLYPTNIDDIEKNLNRTISLYKEKYGDNYFYNDNNNDMTMVSYNIIGEDGKLSAREYLDYRLLSEGGYTPIVIILVLFISSLLLSLWITYYFIFFPRHADFYFDRDKRIVYTWHFGKVMACKYENLGILENKIGLALVMYGDSPKKSEYKILSRYIQPTDKANFNTQDDNTHFLAMVVKFMEYGKSAILIGDEYETKQYLFFREDPKPDNYEQRLEEILKRQDALVSIYEKNVGIGSKDKQVFTLP